MCVWGERESNETFCGPARLRPSHPSITPCYDHMRQQQIQEENIRREKTDGRTDGWTTRSTRIATTRPGKNRAATEPDEVDTTPPSINRRFTGAI
ncbi:unnamed protein product [Nippostrongylus brasiliensis]|uniref:Uncharacterized protein n=1 Tax=Nippostrongylus brasiliensis TaxID=27835 RepID=A0A0N4XWX6_NIPBR|nr:unnamed protein product [Nippostrongylus brasiliensis]